MERVHRFPSQGVTWGRGDIPMTPKHPRRAPLMTLLLQESLGLQENDFPEEETVLELVSDG